MTQEEQILINRIDDVLKYFNQPKGALVFRNLEQISNELPYKIETQELIEILYKLEKDHHIHAELPTGETSKKAGLPSDVEIYFSTFQGRLFALRGGYLEEYKSLDARKRREVYLENQSLKNGNRLNWLTGVLSVGTFALVFWDMWKYFHSCH